MPSVDDLRNEWLKTKSTFASRMDELIPAETITSDAEYAKNAWHNRLCVWCAELDELLLQYPDTSKPARGTRRVGPGGRAPRHV